METEEFRKRLSEIKGVITYDLKEKKEIPAKKAPVFNLSDSHFPRYNKFNLKKYKSNSILVEWSRGCIGNCAFCIGKRMLGSYRTKDPKKVVDELEYHNKNYGIEDFTVIDNLVNGNLLYLKNICNEIITRKLKIKWRCEGIVRKDMDLRLIKKMKDAGCIEFQLGIESGSEKILKNMKKPYSSVSSASQNLKDLKSAGIRTMIFIMIGFPTETENDFEQTLKFIKQNQKYIDVIKSINEMHIIAGTDVYDNKEKYKITMPNSDWHYKWETKDSTEEIRHKRTKRMISLANELKIPFMETNLMEGKEKGKSRIDPGRLKKLSSEIITNKLSENKEPSDYENRNPYFRISENKKEDKNKEQVNPDVLFVTTPSMSISIPSISFAYLAEYLIKKDIRTALYDLNLKIYEECDNSMKKLWNNDMAHYFTNKDKFSKLSETFNYKSYTKDILKEHSLIIGFSVNVANLNFTKNLIKEIKKQNKNQRIIVGGLSAYTKKDRSEFEGLVDFFSPQEGESALYDLILNLKENKTSDIPEIKGLVTIKDQKESSYQPRKYEDLEKLPYPTYSLYNLKGYKSKIISIITTKGCIGNCTFCEDHTFQGKYRKRSIKGIIDEIKFHIKNTKPEEFWFNDLAIDGDTKFLEGLCDEIIKEDIKITWIALAIAHKGLTLDLLNKMKKAGCKTLNFGIESGSDHVLKLMKKMFTKEQASEVMRNTKKAGINVQPNFIFGFPGETEEDFEDTLKFIKNNRKSISGITNINSCVLPENSDIYINHEKYNISDDNGFVHPVLWKTKDLTNTPKKRSEKLKKAIDLCRKLDLSIYFTNLDELTEKQSETEKEEPWNNNKMALVDEARIGIKKSEETHRGLYAWSQKTDSKKSSYLAENNIVLKYNKISHCRDFATIAGIELSVKKGKKTKLAITLDDNSYDFSDLGTAQKPCLVKISSNDNNYTEIGSFTITGKREWKDYIFNIDENMIMSDKIRIILDDTENYKESGTGKSIMSIRLYQ